MKYLRLLVLFGLIFALPPGLRAERPGSNGEHYRVKTLEGPRFVLHHAWLNRSGVTGLRIGDRETYVPRDSLLGIEVRNGSHARVGLLIGVTVGSLAALRWYIAESDNPNRNLEATDYLSRVFIYPLSGAMIGFAVGVFIPNWEQVDMSSVMSMKPSTGLGLALRF